MPFPSQYGTVNKSVHQHNLQMAVQKVHVPQQDKGQWVPWVSSLLGFRQGLRRGVREEKGAGKPWECMSTQIKAALQEACYWSKMQTALRSMASFRGGLFHLWKTRGKGEWNQWQHAALIYPQGLANRTPFPSQSLKIHKRPASISQAGAHGCSASSRTQGSEKPGPVKLTQPMAEQLEFNHPQGVFQAKPFRDSMIPSCLGRNLFSGALQKGF